MKIKNKKKILMSVLQIFLGGLIVLSILVPVIAAIIDML
jgi:hypothetical protein